MKRIGIFGEALAFLALAATAMGQSVPSFAPAVSYSAPGASAAASGDFNGDGKADVVTANGIASGSHGVSILLSNGDGTFQAARNFLTGTDPTGIAVGDFNGDGKLDVAVANGATNTLSILLGNGDGTLQAATTVGLAGQPFAIFAADFNADGKKDLAVLLYTGVAASGVTYADAILMSNGDGTFSQSTFTAPSGLAVGDFNGDGKTDLVLYGLPTGASAAIKFGNGDGTFTDSPLPFSTFPFQPSYVVVGDFNGDGKMDIYGEFVGRGSRGAFLQAGYMAIGHGDGTFTVTYTGLFNQGIGGQNLLVGDFNRDGKLDVAGVFPGPLAGSLTGNPPPSIKILYGAGDGTFNGYATTPAGPSTGFFTSTTSAMVSGDFDGNGALDFAWATGAGINVVRNANGNPPLLSKLSLGSTFVVGGATTVSGTVTIGDPAPAGGAVIALTSSDQAAAFFAGGGTVTIPAGSTSANFNITTGAVAAAELVTITASWNGVNVPAAFHVNPALAVSTVTFAPASTYGMFGGFSFFPNGSVGTVTLSGPASDGGATINLTSSNPALVSVPATVVIAAGTTTAVFFVRPSTNVSADTPVTISGSYQGVAKSGVFTVLTATDAVQITKAEFVVKTGQWKIEATGTDATAFIFVLNPEGVVVGSLVNLGLGAYKGQGNFGPGPLTTAVLQSTKGGITRGPVAQK